MHTGKPDGVEQYAQVKEPFVQVSQNLVNPAHLDPNDLGRSHAVWMRKLFRQREPKGWYLLFPDVGLAIELVHGACISWNGSEVRHCTSKASDVNCNDTLFSYFFGMSKLLVAAQQRLAQFKAIAERRKYNQQDYPELKVDMEVLIKVCHEKGMQRVRRGSVVAASTHHVSIAFHQGKDAGKPLLYEREDEHILVADYEKYISDTTDDNEEESS